MTPPELTIRSFTNDQYYLDKVFYANSYHFKSLKELSPVVVDIGAHCGYFSFAALSLGAKQVFAFEPYPDNYKVLIKNIGSADCYQIGTYISDWYFDMQKPEIVNGSYVDFAHLKIAEGDAKPDKTIFCLSLDNILTKIVKQPVDILKINIGYSEIDILTNSHAVEAIQHVCGESEIKKEDYDQVKAKMAKKGFMDSILAPVPDEPGKSLFHFSRTKCEPICHKI